MKKIAELLNDVKTMGIAGHIHPDGDCVGSCMALYLYIKECYPEIQVDVYLEDPKTEFSYIARFDEIKMEAVEEKVYDLFVTCDVSSRDRLAIAGDYFQSAKKTVCIDHHISNPGFADINCVKGDVSSASEVLYGLLDAEKITLDTAVSLYTGMVHDTGVFQYSSTTPETMRIAGELMRYGFDFNKIIDETFYQKTYKQMQIMGRVLAESQMFLDGKCITGFLKKEVILSYEADSKDFEGIVSQLRFTKGIEAAVFLYEQEENYFKVSMRSNGNVDVSQIAVLFGGGGHRRAAGCQLSGDVEDIIRKIVKEIEKQICGEFKE